MLVGLDRTKPGAMQFTVIPEGPSSCAICLVKPICAAFALVYAWMPVLLTVSAAADEIVIIRPQRRSFIPGTTARVQRNAVVRFASITSRQSWSDTSSSGLPTSPQTPPALLTRMSTGPRPAKNSLTAAALVRSAVSLSTPCTTAPLSVSAAAMPAPMPCAVPVTTAVRPARPVSCLVIALIWPRHQRDQLVGHRRGRDRGQFGMVVGGRDLDDVRPDEVDVR